MAIRFSDNLFQNTEGSDFIVRRRTPLIVQMVIMFAVAFFAIYITATIMSATGSKLLFFVTLTLVIGALGWFTIFFAQRSRDLVLATEFQNALFASAAKLSTRFCLIAKRDGTIVYIDSGFQNLFPEFLHTDSRSVDMLLRGAGIEDATREHVNGLLDNNQDGRTLLKLHNPTGEPVPIMLTIDVLPRPQGYLLLRGRDYVEKRQNATNLPSASGLSVLAHALQGLAEGVLTVDGAGHITYANHAIEEWLGYGQGEILSSGIQLAQLIYQYDGAEPGKLLFGDFAGDVLLTHKNGAMVTLSAQQTVVGENGVPLGMSLLFISPESKKKLSGLAEEGLPQLSSFIAASPIAIARIGTNGTVRACNRSLRDLLRSLSVRESGWAFLDIVHPDNRAEVTALLDKLREGKPIDQKPVEIRLNTEETISTSLYLSRIEDGEIQIIAQLIDTSEQKNLEVRFAHSQKMQAVGQLAGGVAHDFNNLLTAMIGFCDLLLMRHPAGDQSFADIMQVKQNANRAANLVRQLLAFSRRQTLQPKMLDITDVLAELSNLVRRLIGENIELKMNHGRDLGMVKADQGQLEQVFINLAVNARDAMTGGGTLTIKTSYVKVDRKNPISRDLIPPAEDEAIVDGEYVLVEMIDTGTGIPRDITQKIFEPFFSTKEVGAGTGLGLATVYGIIKQTGGYIYVSSKEGEGTKFSLFFKHYKPEAVKPAAEAEVAEKAGSDDLTGKGTVLLVEDETPVRTFAARALRNKGYTVLEADCGETAVEVMEAQGSEVDVIVTDVIMPGMNGPTMIETVAPKFPRVKVIFISGYAEDVFVKSYGSEREFNFLPKPFTLKQLASKVKEVMAK